tara:strand:+ start:4070 stop:6181 length:2112 start_codon:yes stop_codon:yes gene_type:complete
MTARLKIVAKMIKTILIWPQRETTRHCVFVIEKILSVFVALFCAESLASETQYRNSDIDTVAFKFEPINVTAINQSKNNPLSETLISGKKLELYTISSSLNKVLRNSPGLFALSDYNNVQDSRISIRGFGTRSNFGIRGIKILVDGVPESTPDGQGQVDNISMDYFEQVSVFRGSTSILFGNASGGAINFISKSPRGYNFTKSNMIINSLNDKAFTFLINRKYKSADWNFQYHVQNQNGHRDHSSSHSSIFNFQLKWGLKAFENFVLSINQLHSPYALDPGALTLEQKNENPQMARSANQLYDSRESVTQSKVSLKTEKFLNGMVLLKTNIWFLHRVFNNKLPFENSGQVALLRNYYGFDSRLIYQQNFGNIYNNIMLGFEMNSQVDDRKRFDNIYGEKGSIKYDGEEKFFMSASYLQWMISYRTHQIFSALRFDYNRASLNDKLLENKKTFYDADYQNYTPLLGYRYKINEQLSYFINYTTHFETPTLYETGNSPELRPQRNQIRELGIFIENSLARHGEIVLFESKVENEIVPYEVEDEPGRSYFKNAGITRRRGLEFSLSTNPYKKLEFQYTHTHTDYKFIKFGHGEDILNGNFLPAIPRYFGKFNFLYSLTNNLNIDAEIYYAGKVYFDDQNTAEGNGYLLTNLKIENVFNIFERGTTLFIYIGNVLDTDYNSNIRINAYNDRYYEPAPSRYYSVGLKF